MMEPVPILEIDNSCLNIMAHIVGLENCFALIWSICKPSAYGVKYCLGLKLATECAIVDHDRWEQV